MRKLIILRGVSGSGKSTFAKTLVEAFTALGLKAIDCAADDFFYDREGNYNFDVTELQEAHSWCKERVEVAMEGGVDVIILSNTSTAEWEFKPYMTLAGEYGYTVDSLIKENRHNGKSVHDVPDKILEVQRQRLRNNLSL